MASKKKAAAEEAAALMTSVPEWCSPGALAQLIGLDERRVQQLRAAGVLETEIPPGRKVRKYRTCKNVQSYIAYKARARKEEESGGASELVLKKLAAEVKLKESQGQLHRLKTAIAEGKYIPAEQAAAELAEFMAEFKKFAMNIPARTAGNISGDVDALTVRALEKAMREELETMLNTFLDTVAERQNEVDL